MNSIEEPLLTIYGFVSVSFLQQYSEMSKATIQFVKIVDALGNRGRLFISPTAARIPGCASLAKRSSCFRFAALPDCGDTAETIMHALAAETIPVDLFWWQKVYINAA